MYGYCKASPGLLLPGLDNLQFSQYNSGFSTLSPEISIVTVDKTESYRKFGVVTMKEKVRGKKQKGKNIIFCLQEKSYV